MKNNLRKSEVPGWLGALVVGGTFLALFIAEWRRPLRRTTEPKLRRNARNFAVAALSAGAIQLVERPVVAPLARLVTERRWGLLQRLPLPLWLEVLLATALLDYTLYLWHVLTHKSRFLWRFHQVHYLDLDMDASTGLRFHFGEMLLSVISRAPRCWGSGFVRSRFPSGKTLCWPK